MWRRMGVKSLPVALVLALSSCAFWAAGQSSPPEPRQSVGLQLIAEGLTSPLALVPSPDGTGRLFLVDQVGMVWVVMPDGTRLPEPFLDLRSRLVTLNPSFDERGLLGLAFHQGFQTNGRFFVYYSARLRPGGPAGWNHTSHVSEFKVAPANANKATLGSERIVLQVDEPQSNHNGGQITFGPDGFLYIPLGDGGAGNDLGLGHSPLGNGQDITTLLGKVLRIDVDGAEPYAIPPDNPFVGKDGRPEVFAYGFRNPFRISFDSAGNHELYAGDAGQNLWEEVDIVTKGGNYGWNIREGAHCFDPDNPQASPAHCPAVGRRGEALLDPIIEYQNAGGGGTGTAVIGGFVYRGKALPDFVGAYIFGDFSASSQADGVLFIAHRPASPGAMWTVRELQVKGSVNGRINAFIRSFGQDASGELYVLVADSAGPVGNSGSIYKIVP